MTHSHVAGHGNVTKWSAALETRQQRNDRVRASSISWSFSHSVNQTYMYHWTICQPAPFPFTEPPQLAARRSLPLGAWCANVNLWGAKLSAWQGGGTASVRDKIQKKEMPMIPFLFVIKVVYINIPKKKNQIKSQWLKMYVFHKNKHILFQR